jgi:transposase
MWTKEHRERQRYATDLSDREWEYIQPLLPPPARRGRKAEVDMREVLNALRYLARTSCG